MSKKLSNGEYILRCNEKHDNFYDYSKTTYTGYRNPIVIIDPLFLYFRQHIRLYIGRK